MSDEGNPPPKEVQQIFHTTINGNVGNLATASSHFQQQTAAALHGNLAELKRQLQGHGVASADIDALEVAIVEDTQAGSNGTGPKTKHWIKEMLAKAGSDAWSIGVSTAKAILPKVVSDYLGSPAELP